MQDMHMNDIDILDDIAQEENGEDFGIATKDPHVTIVNNEYVIGSGKKFVRTMLKLDDGSYVTARINMSTGEIQPYNYTKKPKSVKAKPKKEAVERVVDYGAAGNLLDYEPSWLHISKTKRDIADTKVDGVKPPLRKSLSNPNRTILAEFNSGIGDMQAACAKYPWLEDILFGVTHLDCGNTRPFSMTQFFYMLRDLETINVETLYAYTTCGEKHCYRLAQYMRVLVTAFNREVTR